MALEVCEMCGSEDCSHTVLERIYGISEMGRDEKDEALDRKRDHFDRLAEEEMQRLEDT